MLCTQLTLCQIHLHICAHLHRRI